MFVCVIQVLAKLYLESATLVWNGNAVNGAANITKFMENLPTSVHLVDALDAQPIAGIAITLKINVCSGTVGLWFVMFYNDTTYLKHQLKIAYFML